MVLTPRARPPPPTPTPTPTPTPSPALPPRYVQYVEDKVGVHCKWIGVGPGRDAIVIKPLKA